MARLDRTIPFCTEAEIFSLVPLTSNFRQFVAEVGKIELQLVAAGGYLGPCSVDTRNNWAETQG